MIKGTTKLLGVIGHPVEHSLSPAMHNTALSHLGLDCVYLPFPVKPENLKTALEGFASVGVLGFSVTIPHKQTIIPLLSEVSELAQAVGAVNTVYWTEKGWAGTNTDVAGFLAPLISQNSQNWEQRVAVILGTGGAARAVVAGCDQLGCPEIWIVGRNPQKLAEFQQSWQTSALRSKLHMETWENLPAVLSRADLLVNATPIGMYPNGEQSPLDEASANQLKQKAIAYDLIYTPNPTQFLKQAQIRGLTAIDGLEMLVQQGAVAFELWLRQKGPVDVMRYCLQQHLGL